MSLPIKYYFNLYNRSTIILHKSLVVKSVNVLSCRNAVFPKEYQKPITDPQILNEIEESSELEKFKFQPILPASISVNSSVFYDELYEKLIRKIMSGGKKRLARELLEKTFYNIKKIQLKKYYEAETEEERQEIELNPLFILHGAFQNCKPILTVQGVKRGATMYQVPKPLTDEGSEFLCFKWILEAARDKGTKVHLPDKLSKELVDAFYNEGKVIKKKQDLHKMCEGNRAYAHFRWT